MITAPPLAVCAITRAAIGQMLLCANFGLPNLSSRFYAHFCCEVFQSFSTITSNIAHKEENKVLSLWYLRLLPKSTIMLELNVHPHAYIHFLVVKLHISRFDLNSHFDFKRLTNDRSTLS